MEKALASTAGYKALLVDKETRRMVATVYGKSKLHENNIFTVEVLGAHDGSQF